MATPANTPTTYYLDTPDVRAACADDFKKIDKACKPEEERSDKNRHPVLKKMLGAKRVEALEAMVSKVKAKYPFTSTAGNGWMSHCDGLWMKPDSKEYADEFNSLLKGMSDDLAGTIEAQLKPLLDKVGQEIKDKAVAAAKEKALKMGARSAARWGVGLGGAAVGGVGAIVTEGVATAWNVYDWGSTAYETYQISSEAYGTIKEMGSILDIAKKAQDELAALAGNMANKTPTDLMADGMGVLSRLNACTRARRCKLVPYNKTGAAESLGGDGCCPGQTGHHILPDEMTKNGNCPGYTKGSAPTVCVEGANNSNGSHGMAHQALDRGIQRHRNGWFGSDTLSYGKARDIGVRSVQETFPESKCDTKCLRAQLDAYYKSKCNKPLPAVSGLGGAKGGGGSGGPGK
jgi:hypothetical protein